MDGSSNPLLHFDHSYQIRRTSQLPVLMIPPFPSLLATPGMMIDGPLELLSVDYY